MGSQHYQVKINENYRLSSPDVILLSLRINLVHNSFLILTDNSIQVAERSLYFLNKTYILALIEENIQQVMPAIVPELVQTASNHWCHSIVLLVCELLRSLMELDEELFSELVAELDQEAESTVSVDSLERRSTARKTIQAGMNRASDLKKRESVASLSPNANSGSKNDKYVRRHK